MPEASDALVHGARTIAPMAGSVVTLGTFDGVHLGHQALLARAKEEAERQGVPSVAYTFEPHPAKVLAPERAPAVLLTLEERVRIILEHGIDRVIAEPFTKELADLEARTWVRDFLVAPLRPRHLVVGFNFSFGRGRSGTPALLSEIGTSNGFSVDVVEPIEIDGDVISSTRIRKLLADGNVAAAARLLGRPFRLSGTVVEGDRRGRTIGVPTANLRLQTEVTPRFGVYASILNRQGRAYPAVTNIGERPTFTAGLSVETHVLDFDEDLYGAQVEVDLLERLRGEQKFDGVDSLVAQIRRDIEDARAVFSARG